MTFTMTLAALVVLSQAPAAVDPPHHHHHQAPAEKAAAPSTRSLYNLGAKWKDSTGKRLVLQDLRGKVVVLSMIYTSCQTVCPLIASDVARIFGKLPEAVRPRVHLVLVSFDPERDTPAKLASYAASRRLEGAQWTLLTGDPNGVRDLAALLGMKYRSMGNGDFAHSNLITVLDQEGVIVHRSEGVGQDAAAIVDAIVSAAPSSP